MPTPFTHPQAERRFAIPYTGAFNHVSFPNEHDDTPIEQEEEDDGTSPIPPISQHNLSIYVSLQARASGSSIIRISGFHTDYPTHEYVMNILVRSTTDNQTYGAYTFSNYTFSYDTFQSQHITISNLSTASTYVVEVYIADANNTDDELMVNNAFTFQTPPLVNQHYITTDYKILSTTYNSATVELKSLSSSYTNFQYTITPNVLDGNGNAYSSTSINTTVSGYGTPQNFTFTGLTPDTIYTIYTRVVDKVKFDNYIIDAVNIQSTDAFTTTSLPLVADHNIALQYGISTFDHNSATITLNSLTTDFDTFSYDIKPTLLQGGNVVEGTPISITKTASAYATQTPKQSFTYSSLLPNTQYTISTNIIDDLLLENDGVVDETDITNQSFTTLIPPIADHNIGIVMVTSNKTHNSLDIVLQSISTDYGDFSYDISPRLVDGENIFNASPITTTKNSLTTSHTFSYSGLQANTTYTIVFNVKDTNNADDNIDINKGTVTTDLLTEDASIQSVSYNPTDLSQTSNTIHVAFSASTGDLYQVVVKLYDNTSTLVRTSTFDDVEDGTSIQIVYSNVLQANTQYYAMVDITNTTRQTSTTTIDPQFSFTTPQHPLALTTTPRFVSYASAQYTWSLDYIPTGLQQSDYTITLNSTDTNASSIRSGDIVEIVNLTTTQQTLTATVNDGTNDEIVNQFVDDITLDVFSFTSATITNIQPTSLGVNFYGFSTNRQDEYILTLSYATSTISASPHTTEGQNHYTSIQIPLSSTQQDYTINVSNLSANTQYYFVVSVYNETINDTYSHIDYNYNVLNTALSPTTTENVFIGVSEDLITHDRIRLDIDFSTNQSHDNYTIEIQLYRTSDLTTHIYSTTRSASQIISQTYDLITFSPLDDNTSYTVKVVWTNTITTYSETVENPSWIFQTPIEESVIITYTNVVEASSYIEGTLTFTPNTNDTYTLTSELNGTPSSITLPFTNPIKFDGLQASTSYTIRYDWTNTTRGTNGYILDTYTTERLPSASVSITPDIYSVSVSISNVVLVQGRTYDLKVYIDDELQHTTTNLTGNINNITISELPANTSQDLKVDIINKSTVETTTIYEASFQTLVELVPDHNHTIAYTTNQSDTALTLTLTTFQSNYPNFSYKILPYLHDITANQTYLPTPLSIVLSETTYTNAGGNQQFVWTDFPYSTQLTIKTQIENNVDATDAYTLVDGTPFTTSPAPTPTITAFTAEFEVDGNGDPITTNSGVSYNVNLSYTTTNSTFIDNYIYNNGYTDTFTARSSLTNPTDTVVLAAQFPLNDTTVQGKISSTEVSGVVDTESSLLVVPEIVGETSTLLTITTNSIQFETTLSSTRFSQGDTYALYFTLTSNGSTIQTSQTYSNYTGSTIQYTFENLNDDTAFHVNVYWSNGTHPSGSTTSGSFVNVISTRTELEEAVVLTYTPTLIACEYITGSISFSTNFTSDTYVINAVIWEKPDGASSYSPLETISSITLTNGSATIEFLNLVADRDHRLDVHWSNTTRSTGDFISHDFRTDILPDVTIGTITPSFEIVEFDLSQFVTAVRDGSSRQYDLNVDAREITGYSENGDPIYGENTTNPIVIPGITNINANTYDGRYTITNLVPDQDYLLNLLFNNTTTSVDTLIVSNTFHTPVIPALSQHGIDPSYSISTQSTTATITLSSIASGSSFTNFTYTITPKLFDDTNTFVQNITTAFNTTPSGFTTPIEYTLTDLAEGTYHIRTDISYGSETITITEIDSFTITAQVTPVTDAITSSPFKQGYSYTPGSSPVNIGKGKDLSKRAYTLRLDLDLSQGARGWVIKFGGTGYGGGITVLNNEIRVYSEYQSYYFNLGHNIEPYINASGGSTILEISASTSTNTAEQFVHLWINGIHITSDNTSNWDWICGGGGNSYLGGSPENLSDPNPHDFGSSSGDYFNRQIYDFKFWKEAYITP